MKPRLNSVVYVLMDGNISKEKVGYIGNNDFILEYTYPYEDALKYAYEDYETTWFKSLAKAKSKLKEDNPNIKFVKASNTYWEVEE